MGVPITEENLAGKFIKPWDPFKTNIQKGSATYCCIVCNERIEKCFFLWHRRTLYVVRSIPSNTQSPNLYFSHLARLTSSLSGMGSMEEDGMKRRRLGRGEGRSQFYHQYIFFLFKTSVCLNILTAPLVVWPILFRTIRTTRMTSISRACLTCIYPLRRIYPLRDHWPAHFDTSQQPEPCCGHHGERRYFFDSNAILEL